MLYFHNDYNRCCHEAVTEKLQQLAAAQMPGYGTDQVCASAADKIRRLCQDDELAVHFLVGGTQTNLTVIAAALRPYQAVIGAECAHINVHETGSIEATGHKVLGIPSADGKITAQQVEKLVLEQRESPDAEHIVQPKMVYISDSTELGAVYTLQELKELSAMCRRNGLFLFVDGARLGYALTAEGSDVTLADLARYADVFYIGGTKCGAMFGEAVVISNGAIANDFRYMIKQRGGMLAKGWLLGAQFDALMENDLYFTICARANRQADQIRETLAQLGYPLLVPGNSNQIFPILPDSVLAELGKEFTFSENGRVDENHRAVRFCTSWATDQQSVDALCEALRKCSAR